MSELRIETWLIPSAELGPENPLPPLQHINRKFRLNESSGIPAEIVRNSAYGHVSTILPYTLQDNFDRQLHPKEFRVAILENEILRAAILLQLGGRLWSLIHKPSGQELLEVNPAIQFANLAIRNAWFCGGVEWNFGTIGHSPFTCSPVFAGRIELSYGTPVLRLYEWERLRDIPFQIDIFLPDGSPVLFVKPRIINPHDQTVPIYWWSNIAVSQNKGKRVVVPAESAYCLGCFQEGLTRIKVPDQDGNDITYAANALNAADYFFHISGIQCPWITALDEGGRGLVHVSTNQMPGRKLWVWGSGAGGRNWQNFLATNNQGYIEIQSGLSRTQLEHLPLPAGADLSWLEAYGLLEVDPGKVHNTDWKLVKQAVDEAVKDLINPEELHEQFNRGKEFANIKPEQLIQRGSGWGALEHRRREIARESQRCFSGVIFDEDTLDEQQQPWIQLLENETFPEPSPYKTSGGFVSGIKWKNLLEHSLELNQKNNWFAWYHLGVVQFQAGEIEQARTSWQHSLDRLHNPWSMRNLAILEWEEGNFVRAAEIFQIARDQLPHLVPLTIECIRCMIAASQFTSVLELVQSLPTSIRSLGRIRFLEASAALKNGNPSKAELFFKDGGLVEDLREGEDSLTTLWFELQQNRFQINEDIEMNPALLSRVQENYPLPENIDFRMNPGR